MNNNDVLRRTRYFLNLSDTEMVQTFGAAEMVVTRAEVSDWLKRDDDPAQQPLADAQLATFLNGLINVRRGKRDGPQAKPEAHLSNNMIFMKLKIALNMQADAVLEVLRLAGFSLSRHELSALFRKPGHKHYRDCKDQVLRNFMQGMQSKLRGD